MVSIVYPIHIAMTIISTTPSKIGILTNTSGSKRNARPPNVSVTHVSSPNNGTIANPITYHMSTSRAKMKIRAPIAFSLPIVITLLYN